MSQDKQQLLKSIKPGMKLTKAFFLNVYGYDVSFPGFAEEAIRALNNAGCSKAREYYNKTVSGYQAKRDQELKPTARQIRKQWAADWEKLQKGSEERRKIELMQRKKRLLMQKLQR